MTPLASAAASRRKFLGGATVAAISSALAAGVQAASQPPTTPALPMPVAPAVATSSINLLWQSTWRARDSAAVALWRAGPAFGKVFGKAANPVLAWHY